MLGVFRDHLLARFFGVGGEGIHNLDVYYAAFRIPDFVYALLIMGTVAAAFVPVFTTLIEDSSGKKKEMTRDANLFTVNVLNTLLVAVCIVSGVFFVCASWILQFLVPGFGSADLELTVSLTRLMLLSPIFFSMSSVFQSVQNAFDRFVYYSLAPILYNLGIIIGIYFFAESHGVWGIAGGVILGALFHFGIQLPGVRGLGFRYRLYVSWRDSHLREMVRLVIPRIFGMSVMQVNLIFDTLVGSLLAAGSITVLNYAVNLNSLPMGIVGVSFAVASFATLSSLALGSKEKFAHELSRVVTSILYLVLPATVGLFVLRFQIVDVLLGSGAFTDEDVILTGNTLAFFLIGLIGQSLIPIFARAFYAYKNTLIPVVISVISMIINIGLNFYFALSLDMGVYGIALATSVAALLNMSLLLFFLRSTFLKGVKCIHYPHVGAILLSSLCMGVVVNVFASYVAAFGEISFVYQILALSASILVGVLIFFLTILPFRLEETKIILKKLGVRF